MIITGHRGAAGGDEDSIRRYRERQMLVKASSALDNVLVRTAKEANTLDLVKHTLLMVSLDALEDLNMLFSNERTVGHVAMPPLAAAELVGEPRAAVQ